MILVNLAGGPGSGKSTAAAHLFAELKMEGIRAELVGEEAKELVYDRSFGLLDNQVLIGGLQWQRIVRLQDAGCEVAISDSPLIQGVMYLKDLRYYSELYVLLRKLESLVPFTLNVWVNRVKPYSELGRMQKEEQARLLDESARGLIGTFWKQIDGSREGAQHLTQEILKIVRSGKGEHIAQSKAA